MNYPIRLYDGVVHHLSYFQTEMVSVVHRWIAVNHPRDAKLI